MPATDVPLLFSGTFSITFEFVNSQFSISTFIIDWYLLDCIKPTKPPIHPTAFELISTLSILQFCIFTFESFVNCSIAPIQAPASVPNCVPLKFKLELVELQLSTYTSNASLIYPAIKP